jgi:hypothetical protein
MTNAEEPTPTGKPEPDGPGTVPAGDSCGDVSPVEDAGTGLPGRPPAARRVFVQLHKGAIVFFAIFGAYLISIYLDLWVNMGFSLLLDRAPDALMKFVAVPLALEAGMGLAGLLVLYLVGRFVDLVFWPVLASFWVGLHLLDALMKWLLGQFEWGYGEPRVLLLRLPGFILFFLLSVKVFRLALRRDKE